MAKKSTTPPTWGRFEEVEKEVPYRLIWRSYGPEKTGKDHFGLTAPGPIAIQSFDIGLEGVVEKFLKAPLGPKEIRAVEYEFDKNACSQDDAKALRDQFVEDFELALTQARTIIWDTETELWEVFRYAEFGVMSDAPKNYVKLNSEYRDLIQRAYDGGVNLQLIQKVKEKWISVEAVVAATGRKKLKPQNTGEMEPTGFREAGYLVQVNIQHSWTKEEGFALQIINCRQNMAIAGETFYNTSFPELASLVFPESEMENWE